MPPKKEKKSSVEDVEPDEEEKELLEKGLVISYLKSKIERYQSEGERLQLNLQNVSNDLEEQKKTTSDISEFLSNELKARSHTAAELQQKVQQLNTMYEKQTQECNDKVDKLYAEIEEEREQIKIKEEEMNKKIKGAQEFLDRKDQLEADLASISKELEETRFKYEKRIGDMERKHVQDKDKWNKELERRIKDTKAYMMQLTDNQLEMTTKRTIMENEQMASELTYQSRQTEKLLARNRKMAEVCHGLQQQVDLSNQSQQEFAKRNHAYQRALATLLGKLKTEDLSKQQEVLAVKELVQKCKHLYEAVRITRLEKDEQLIQIEKLQKANEAQQQTISRIQSSKNHSVLFLMQCVQDLKQRVISIVSSEQDQQGQNHIQLLDGNIQDLTPEQRLKVLNHLMDRLHQFELTQTQEDSSCKLVDGMEELSGIQCEDSKTLESLRQQYSKTTLPDSSWQNSQINIQTQRSQNSIGVQTEKQRPVKCDNQLEQLMSDVRPWGDFAQHSNNYLPKIGNIRQMQLNKV